MRHRPALLALALWLAPGAAAAEGACLRYGPVTLSGRLTAGAFMGLALPRSVCFEQQGEEAAARDVRLLHVAFTPQEARRARRLAGREVTVTGEAGHWRKPRRDTKVLLFNARITRPGR